MSFKKRIVFTTLIAVFVLGIITGLIGRGMCVRNNRNYQVLQPELFAPDVISTVLYSENLQQLYVCYNDASYVNVYSINGNFLWAVSTPYLRNAYFELSADQLIIYNGDSAYFYSSSNGSFVKKEDADKYDLSYDWEQEYTSQFEAGTIVFDTYQVYKCEEDGSLTTIVSRPWWYWIFNYGVCLCFSFIGAIGIGIMIFLDSRRDYHNAKNDLKEKKDNKPLVLNRKAKIILNYFRVATIIHLLYAVLDVLGGIWLDGVLCIGLLPLGIHFIISNAVLWNLLDDMKMSDRESKIIDYWKICEIGSFIIAFLSVIVAVAFCE